MEETSIQKTATNGAMTTTPTWSINPATDVFENPEGYWLMLDVPGVDPSTIDVQVIERTVHVRARQLNRPAMTDAAIGEYRRAVQLPKDVDAGGVKAEYDRGVLDIRLPKAASARSVKIPVALK